MQDTVNLRVAFATPFNPRVEFAIGLNGARTTEAQMIQTLSQGVLYEQFTSWVMISLLRPGDVAVDVGAHVGYYTLLMRTLVGEQGQVKAAEPLRESYLALLANIARNGYRNIAPQPIALSDVAGKAHFTQDARNEGESHLTVAGEAGSELVLTQTLDQWLADLSEPVRLLKLDAEGTELKIIAGAGEVFERHPPDAVICEINPPALNRYGASVREVRQRFKSLGYYPYLINVAASGPYDICGGAIVKPLADTEEVTAQVVHNLLFCRPGVVPIGLGL